MSDEPEKKRCPECDGELDEDGYTKYGDCSYGPEKCSLCDNCYCDQSC